MPPTAHTKIGGRSMAYFNSSAVRRGYPDRAMQDLRHEFEDLMVRAEAHEPGLASRIESALSDATIVGVYERDFIKKAVASVLGEGVARRGSRSRVRSLDDFDVADDPRNDPSRIADRNDRMALLKEQFTALDRGDRYILRCIYSDGLKKAEVARGLGMPPQTLHDDHEKAIKRLIALVRRARPTVA